MKKLKWIITISILVASLSFLYAEWDFVAGGYISKVDFVGNNGWAVSSEGLVMHTPDGGTTWEYQETATTERLYDVSFVDDLEGWVAGNDGLIFHTTDGGNTWIQQNSSTTTNLQSINFVDALNGWAAGSYGTLLHTSDGGVTWSSQTSGISSKIYSIFFIDALNGWAVAGSDYIIHTTDGGATWTTQTNPTTDSMKDVIFYDANEGWAAGQHSIIHTVDGGATWVEQANPGVENFYGIGMGDNNHLWVVGIDGEILATTDGGANWVEQNFSMDWFLGAYFEDSLTGWIVGAGGAIYKTIDGGTTWIIQQAGTSSGLRRTVFVDDNNVWGCGTKGFIIHSGDGGLTWESKDSGFDDWIWDITFAPDQLHGWAACDDQTGETPILATVDGGETWVQQLTGIYEDVVGIDAVSTTEVFAAAKSGIILHTTDGGTTWNQQTSGVSVDFKSIEMVSEDIGWIIGSDGTIIHTTDGGTTWIQQTSGTTESIYDVSFVDSQNGWAVGYNGVILHTTDGGTTWTQQTSGTTNDFTRVSVIDLNEVWAIAGEGYHTTDGGLNWTAVPIPCSIGLWGVDFANSDLGIAMGNGGIITRYTSVTLNSPQNLFVTETGYATWDPPAGGGGFFEGFEGTFPPDGWLKLNPDGGTGWEPLELGTTPLPGWTGGEATACPDGGQWQAYATWTTGGASFNDQWIITPQITVQAGDMLDFYMVYYYDSYADHVEILISTTVQNDPAAFDTVVDMIDFPVGSPTDWAAYSYNLTDFVSAGTDVYIAFRENVVDNWNDGSAISIDNVYVGQPVDMAPVIPVIAQKETRVERAVNYVHIPNTRISTVSTVSTVSSRDFLGYNVYLDGAPQTFTTDEFYQYTGLNSGQTYLAEVTALYDEGESDPIEYTFTYIEETFDPPANVAVDEETGTVSWDAPAGAAIISEDFESYNVGEYLAVQSVDWTTWSGAPGGAEDALISDAQALSGTNSVVVEGLTDLVLIMNDYTSGVYSMEVNLFVPTGYCGYWNLQKTSTPGQEWAFQIMFDATGVASADAGGAAALNFSFNFDTWINMELIIDLDTDWCEIWVDGVMLHEYQWSLGCFGTAGLLSLGGMNLYAWSSATADPMCYFDDIEFEEITSDTRDLTGYNIYLDGALIESNIMPSPLEYTYSGLIPLQEYTAGVSAVYDEPVGESEIIEVPFTYDPIFNPPQTLAVVCIEDYAHFTWEAPAADLSSRGRDTKAKAEETRDLTGYNVYLDQVEVANNIPDLEYDFYDLVNGDYYDAGVKAVYDDGTSELVEINFLAEITGAGNILPLVTKLTGNYPNPFNPETNIAFSLKEAGKVTLEIYNIKGEKVRTLVKGHLEAAYHNIIWNSKDNSGKQVASGVYFYKMKTGKYVSTRKMILLK